MSSASIPATMAARAQRAELGYERERMNNWRGTVEFMAVVEHGSFTAAAAHLGLSKSYISKSVSELEAHFGVQLLFRTTRRLSLTPAGELFYQRCQTMRAIFLDTEREIGELQERPVGRLRIGLSDVFGVAYMSAVVASFAKANPDVTFEVEAYLRDNEVAYENFDVVFRYGKLADSEMKSRRVGYLSYCLCAAPAYLADHPWPTDIAGFADHECLPDPSGQFVFNDPAGNHAPLQIKVKGRWTSNSGMTLAAAAKQGMGIAQLPTSVIRDDLARGHLVALEEDWAFFDRPVWAVFSPGPMPAATRVFIDYVASRFDGSKIRPATSSDLDGLAQHLKV